MAVQDDDLDLDVEAEEGGSGGGSKKKIIIIAIAVVLFLSISGAATLFLLGGDSKPAAEPMAGADGKEAGKEEAKAVSEPVMPLLYVGLNPPFVVNFSASEDVRFLQIDVQISTRDPSMVERIREHDPAIRNNLVILFSSQDPDELNSREGKEKLRKQVLAEVKKVMKQAAGSDNIENVYFTNFVMQ